MDRARAIQTLRFALASIWTELEKDQPSLEDCQRIADDALDLTKSHAEAKSLTSQGTGLEGWLEYKQALGGSR